MFTSAGPRELVHVYRRASVELPVNYLRVTAASSPVRTRDYSIPVDPVGLLHGCLYIARFSLPLPSLSPLLI